MSGFEQSQESGPKKAALGEDENESQSDFTA